MEKSSFFNAELVDGEYDRVYLAEDYARYFSSFIGNGVFPNPSTNLKVVASGENMKVTVKAGKAWINGYYYENDSDLTLIIDNADGVLNRIDRVVVCLDHLKREINVKIKKGDYSSNPMPKEITRNDDIYELALADIKVGNGVISIQNSYINDLRLNKELCGVVCGTVHEVDTTDIFNTYQNYLNEKMNSNEFDEWFNGLKNKLNPEEDAALNLQFQINEIDKKIDGELKTSEKKNLVNAINEVFTSASNGKREIAEVITGKGVYVDSNMTFNELASSIDQLSLSSYSSGTTVVKGNDEKVIRLGFDPDVLIWKIKYTMNSKSYTVCSIYSYSGMEFNAKWIDGTAVPVEGSPRFCNEDIIFNGTSFIILNSSNVEKTYRWEAYKIDGNVMTGDRDFT